MKYTFLPLLIFVLLCSDLSFAQQYVNLSVDNDLYFKQDWYYSSGIFISTGKLKQEEDQETAFPKRYVHWTLGQEIYTPSRRYSLNVDLYDYPYGGWLFLERSFENIKAYFRLGEDRYYWVLRARLLWLPIFKIYITAWFWDFPM